MPIWPRSDGSNGPRPTWIAFDLNGTLLDPSALLGAGREQTGRAALDDAVMQAMADTITGVHRPFPDYLKAALERRLQRRTDEST